MEPADDIARLEMQQHFSAFHLEERHMDMITAMQINYSVSAEELSTEVIALQYNNKNQLNFDELLRLACSKYSGSAKGNSRQSTGNQVFKNRSTIQYENSMASRSAGTFVRSDASRDDTFSLIAATKRKHYNQSKLH